MEHTRPPLGLEHTATENKPGKLAERTSGLVHQAALREFVRYFKSPTNVLDLGAGTGAWAARLVSLGHSVTCIDQNTGDFALESAHFENADLNDNFSSIIKDRYAAITAIEVIEHLENPRHF